MGIKASTKGLKAAGTRLRNTGIEIMRDSARGCQRKAQAEARERAGDMKEKIVVIPTAKGAIVEAGSPISAFHEYGTGEHAEDGDGRDTPWVYYDEYLKQWFTTTGVTPQPFMRPGFREGVGHFREEKRRRGL